jgi:hypothetical protein
MFQQRKKTLPVSRRTLREQFLELVNNQ